MHYDEVRETDYLQSFDYLFDEWQTVCILIAI